MVSDGSVILSSGHENHDVAVKLGKEELESILTDMRVKRGLSPGQISSFVVLKINMYPHNLIISYNPLFFIIIHYALFTRYIHYTLDFLWSDLMK